MEKVRFGLIGIGAQGGAYAGFLSGKGGFPGMPAPECPPHCALGALCDIDPEKEAMCKEKYPEVPFFKRLERDGCFWNSRCSNHNCSTLLTYRNRNLLSGTWNERTCRETSRGICKICS